MEGIYATRHLEEALERGDGFELGDGEEGLSRGGDIAEALMREEEGK